MGFPGGASGTKLTCQCRRHKKCKFHAWVGKIPWRRARLTHSSVLAWRIPWTEEPASDSPQDHTESDLTEAMHQAHTHRYGNRKVGTRLEKMPTPGGKRKRQWMSGMQASIYSGKTRTLNVWGSKIKQDGSIHPWLYFANKGPSGQGYGFARIHVWMWELDYKESWAPKNCCFWTVVLEKTVESPLDSKEIQPVHPKGPQSWVFIERTDVEAETPILWPPGVTSRLIWKDPDARKDWRQEERRHLNRGWDGRMTSPT